MKIRIKKGVKTGQYAAFFVSALVILSIGFWSPYSMSQLYLLWIVCAIIVCNDYYIVDNTHLKQNFRKIDIRQIHDIVQQPEGLDIRYRNTSKDREHILHLRPHNQKDLIAKLLEINPNINIK